MAGRERAAAEEGDPRSSLTGQSSSDCESRYEKATTAEKLSIEGADTEDSYQPGLEARARGESSPLLRMARIRSDATLYPPKSNAGNEIHEAPRGMSDALSSKLNGANAENHRTESPQVH